MTSQKDELSQVYERIQALGDVLLMACFRDEDIVMKVVSQLPYVKVDPPNLTARAGTDAQAIGNVILKDDTKGFTLITGGNLTPEETKMAMGLLNRYGEDQVFAVPRRIGSGMKPTSTYPSNSKMISQGRKPWWKFW